MEAHGNSTNHVTHREIARGEGAFGREGSVRREEVECVRRGGGGGLEAEEVSRILSATAGISNQSSIDTRTINTLERSV